MEMAAVTEEIQLAKKPISSSTNSDRLFDLHLRCDCRFVRSINAINKIGVQLTKPFQLKFDGVNRKTFIEISKNINQTGIYEYFITEWI